MGILPIRMSGDHDQHRPFEDLAVRHVMGSLDPGEASTFRSHLLDCGECRARVGELRSIASDLADVERAERRERAAQRVEIKEREDDEGETVEPDLPPRAGRGVMIAVVLLVVVLSIWNFVLRGQNDSLQATLVAEQQSAAVINFGEPWTVVEQAAGVEGVARVEQGSLAVMVRGTDDRAPYVITLYDASGTRIHTEAHASVNQQVSWFRGPVSARAARIDVSLDRDTGQTVVFRAEDPALADS